MGAALGWGTAGALSLTLFSFGLWGFLIRNARQNQLALVAFFLFIFLLGMTLSYEVTTVAELDWLTSTITIFAGTAGGYFLAWLINVHFIPHSVGQGIKLVWLRVVSDFRVSAVIIALLLSCVMTFYFARFYHDHHAGFWEAFYAAWVSGLLFFSVVGLVGGLVTLYRPERDIFLARVKILVGGKSGPFMDYIAEEIRGIGYISRLVDRVVTIEDYDATQQMFKVSMQHRGYLRNVLEDVEAIAKGQLTITPDKMANPPVPLGQVLSLQLSGTNLPGLPLNIDLDGFDRSWQLPVPAEEEAVVDYEYWCWVPQTETHTFTLSRFAEQAKVEFRNRCNLGGKRLIVKFKLTTSSESTEQVLEWNGKCSLKEPLLNLRAGVQVYAFQIGVSS